LKRLSAGVAVAERGGSEGSDLIFWAVGPPD
jgi:hypothetical protein